MLAAGDDTELRLTARAVHVWKAPLDVGPETLAWLAAPLCEEEIERAHRFVFTPDRVRWTAARGWLRRLLALYLRRDPAGLRLRVSASGKPALQAPAEWLRFNLSHSADLAVFAVARGREVGVDVERLDSALGADPVPRRFLTATEQAVLARLGPQERASAALRCWTAKEAYAKAIGAGLDAGLAELDTSGLITGGGPLTPPSAAGRTEWSLHGLDPGPGYVAAVGAQGRDARIPERAEPLPFTVNRS